MSKNRGLYGQQEGNETRSQQEVFADRLQDNQLCEGDYLRPMISRAKQGAMDEIARLREKMIKEYISGGVSREQAQKRADSCMSQAMYYLRLKD